MTTLLITIGIVHFLALMTPGPDFLFVSQTAASRSRTDAMLGVLGIVTGVAFWAVLTLLGLQLVFEKFIWLPRVIQLLGGLYLLFLGYLLLLEPSKRLRQIIARKRNWSTRQPSKEITTKKLTYTAPPNVSAIKIDSDKPLPPKELEYKKLEESHEPQEISELGSMTDISSKIDTRPKNTFIFGLLTNLSNPKVIIYFGSVFAPFLGNPDRLDSLIKWELLILIIAETFIWFTIVALIFGLPKLQQFYQRYSIWVDALAGIFFAGFGSHLIFSLKITTFSLILSL